MEALDSLSLHVEELLVRYQALEQENRALKEELERRRDELIRSHSELAKAKHDCQRLHVACALSGQAEMRDEARQRLNRMIAQIDEALKVLQS